MGLILDNYGRPILHPGDVIAIRQFNGRSFESKVREPLRVVKDDDIRIHFKDAMNGKEEWVFKHDVELKLLARADEPPIVES
jgi:hypothetical protein